MRPSRALPAAHFDRNESHVIYGTGHWVAVALPSFFASRDRTSSFAMLNHNGTVFSFLLPTGIERTTNH
jgi:hypothetical protein